MTRFRLFLLPLALLLALTGMAGGCGDDGGARSDDPPTSDDDDAADDDADASDDDDNDDDDNDTNAPGFDSDPQTIDATLVRLLDTVRELAHFPGLAAALVKDGRVIWSRGVGVADLDTERPVEPDTLFLTGSLSKTVLTIALMQLWEQGLFELGDDVNDHLPFDVRHPVYERVPITFQELMTHTSSIADNGPVLNELYTDGDSPLPLTDFLADYLLPDGDFFRTTNFWEYPPEGRWKYSNVAAAAAGLVVESLSGEDFAAYCRRHVLEPLGLDDSGYRLSDMDAAEVAMPYDFNRRAETYEPAGHYGVPFYPAATLRTSVIGLARLLALMSNGGELDGVRLLAPGTVAEIREVPYPDRWPSQGLFWYYGEYDGHEVFGHQGGGDGVAAKMFYRDDGIGVALVANGSWGNLAERLVVEEALILLFRAGERLGETPLRHVAGR